MGNLKQLSLFGFEKIFTAVLGFLTVKLLTSSLSQSEYGEIDLYILTINFVNTLFSWGLGSSVARELLLNKTKPHDAMSAAFALCALSLCLVVFISSTLFAIGLLSLEMVMVGVGSILLLSVNIFLSLSRGISRADYFVYTSITQSLFYVSTILLFSHWNVRVVLLAYILSVLSQLIFLVWLFKGCIKINNKPDVKVVRSMFLYGAPLVLSNIASFLFNLSDRYFVGIYLDYSQLAKYSITYKVCSIMMLLISVVQLIWPKVMYESYDRERNVIIGLDVYFRLYSLFLVLILSFITINGNYIVSFVSDSSYVLDGSVLFFVCSGFMFLGLMYINSSAIHTSGKTSTITTIITLAGVINLILNFVFIPVYGVLGAAVTTFISMFFTFVFSGVFSRKLSNDKLSYTRVLIFYLLSSSVLLVNNYEGGFLFKNIVSYIIIIIISVLLKPKDMFCFFFRRSRNA